jgi:hypothetical protein
MSALQRLAASGASPATNGGGASSGVVDTYSLLDFEQLLALPEPTWLLDRIVPDASLSVLYGASDSYKSFLALDWNLCVATGRSWHGHEVARLGYIVYVAGEGRSGLGVRVRAWWLAHGRPDMSRVRFLPEAINLRDREVIARARRTLASLPERPRLLTIDTMARTIPGGDENSAKDIGEFIASIGQPPADGQLVIHHSGRDGDHERGSTALRGAADMVAKLARTGSGPLAELTCDKLKDGAKWEPVTLQLEPQETGSCVLSRIVRTPAAIERHDRIEADVLAYVTQHAPATKRAVRHEVEGKNDAKDKALDALAKNGRITKTSKGYVPCPEGRGTPGHTAPAASGGGACPAGGDRDVVPPPEGTPPSRAPQTVPEPTGHGDLPARIVAYIAGHEGTALKAIGDAFPDDDPREVLRTLEKLDRNNRVHERDGGWRVVS